MYTEEVQTAAKKKFLSEAGWFKLAFYWLRSCFFLIFCTSVFVYFSFGASAALVAVLWLFPVGPLVMSKFWRVLFRYLHPQTNSFEHDKGCALTKFLLHELWHARGPRVEIFTFPGSKHFCFFLPRFRESDSVEIFASESFILSSQKTWKSFWGDLQSLQGKQRVFYTLSFYTYMGAMFVPVLLAACFERFASIVANHRFRSFSPLLLPFAYFLRRMLLPDFVMTPKTPLPMLLLEEMDAFELFFEPWNSSVYPWGEGTLVAENSL